jgi:prevent-host-death family protein
MSMIVKVHEAKSQLSKLIAAALAGEDVVIARGSEPVVRLVPVQAKGVKRAFGAYRGLFDVPDSAFAALTEDELAVWEDGKV